MVMQVVAKDNPRVADDPGVHRLDNIRVLIAGAHRMEILVDPKGQSWAADASLFRASVEG